MGVSQKFMGGNTREWKEGWDGQKKREFRDEYRKEKKSVCVLSRVIREGW